MRNLKFETVKVNVIGLGYVVISPKTNRESKCSGLAANE